MTTLLGTMRKRLGALVALAWLAGCSDGSGPVCCDPLLPGVIVSNPVASAALTAAAGGALSLAAGSAEDVAYVSLPPGTVPTGARASVRRVGDAASLTTTVTDGGFDPVPVIAQAGESIEVTATDAGGAVVLQQLVLVAAARRPIIVRTDPPPRKRDVPLNANIVIVFSEPIDGRSLTASSVQLLRGATAVAGTVGLLQGSTAAVVFDPSEPLDPSTSYELVVSGGVRDLDGEVLGAESRLEFETGSTTVGAVFFVGVVPDTSVAAVGMQVQLAATAADSVGYRVRGRPILWSSETPTVATVSATGLVTALAPGEARVRAEIDQGVGIGVVLVIETLVPVDSVEISPASATVPVGGGIQLVAVLKDAAGNVLSFRSVAWQTSDPTIASVESTFGSVVVVTGAAPGVAIISATSEGKSGTSAITVAASGSYAQLSVANGHTCGLTNSDFALCWGWNAYGQLGNGTVADAHVPVPVASGLRLSTVSVGWGHSCALTTDGAAYCWGLNEHGQLGTGTNAGPGQCPPAPAPSGAPCSPGLVTVAGGLRFSAIDVGHNYTCALDSGGAAFCWGLNDGGRLGIGVTSGPETCNDQPCSTTPRAVAGGLVFTALDVGTGHACGLTADGAAYCWGGNHSGQLGDGTQTDRAAHVEVVGGLSFVTISVGRSHTCALTFDGIAYCWGGNDAGQLGLGTFTGPEICAQPGGQLPACSTVPRVIPGGLHWRRISAGWHTCAVAESGDAYCWGPNEYGGLGIGNGATLQTCGITAGNPPCSPSPLAVTGGLKFVSVAANDGGHTCGVTTSGVAYCWGENGAGQLGIGVADQDAHPVPLMVSGQP